MRRETLKADFIFATVESVTRTGLASLAQRLRTTLGRSYRVLRDASGRMDLTASQSEALGYLHRDGPFTITALAKRVGVRSQSMGATVGVLLERGLVTVTPDPRDGRQKVVAITEEALRLVSESHTLREDWLAQRLATLTPAEQRTLADASDLLDRLFSEGS